MRRRDFCLATAGMAAAGMLGMLPGPVAAQPRAKIPRIGMLSPEAPHFPGADLIRDGLRELGYVEGHNLAIEYRWAAGQFDRLPALAAQLVALKVDLIVAILTQASLAAKAATHTIPIVMAGITDPVGLGLVASLAHPGGNATGTAAQADELIAKQLQLLQQMVPQASPVALLWNPANAAFQKLARKQVERAARQSGVRLQLLAARAPGDFDAVFAAIREARIRALLIPPDPLFAQHEAALVELTRKNRLPAMSFDRTFAEGGGLVAFEQSPNQVFKGAAAYVDKILKGAKPADLPVEQPTRFELVINLKTAKALGLTIPPLILARADEVVGGGANS